LSAAESFLENGGDLAQLTASIYGSAQFYQLALGANLAGGSNDDFISAIYQFLLHRLPESTGLAGWENALAIGATPAQVASAIVASQEYRQDQVQDEYMTVLSRYPDSVGQDYWVGLLNNAATEQSIIAGLLVSPEFMTNGA
jgi:hypothetical protein